MMGGVVCANNSFWCARLDASWGTALEDVHQAPFLTRAELLDDQRLHAPYGTNLTFPLNEYCRLHQTSGTTTGIPLRCLDRKEDWDWWKRCWGAIFRAASVTRGDRILFPFSFGPFVGFWAAFESAVELGCLALPGGGMTTLARLQFMTDNAVTVLCCTPTYALHMAEVARQQGIDLRASAVRTLIVAGEPGGSIPATRRAIETAFNARLFDHIGMTEVGAYAYECAESPGSVHVNEAEFIVEVIDPMTTLSKWSNLSSITTGAPVEGELVLTNLGRLGFPVIRYRTGDQVQLVTGPCACGSSFARLEGGVIGRTDDMLVIRGNNVYPSALEAILRQFPAVAEYRLIVEGRDALTDLRIEIETAQGIATDGVAEAVTQAVRDRFNFRPCVQLVSSGTLPRFEMKAQRVIRQP
jgi:phenylacetate-CoA ligase